MSAIQRAATWSGFPVSAPQVALLGRLGEWLEEEAISRGAMGPNEAGRLQTRHLADSLLFASGWPHSEPPARVADLGSGAGLPGVPLAILWPNSRVHLVERRAGRCDLLCRVVRLLELDNVSIHQTDAARVELEVEMVVARAAGPAQEVSEWARRLLAPGGVVVLGGSWQEAPNPGSGEEVREVPTWVLDRTVWLRIMAAA